MIVIDARKVMQVLLSKIKPYKKLIYIINLILPFLLLSSVDVFAEEIVQKFSSTQSVELDSNIRLQETNNESVTLFRVMPKYEVYKTDGVNKFGADALFLVQRASDVTLMNDRNDPTINLNWSREFGRGNLSAILHYDKASTRVTELDDSGVIFADGSRISRRATVDWNYFLNEKLLFNLNASNNKVDFQRSALNPFDSQNVISTLKYFYSERFIPTLSAGYIRQDREGSDILNTRSINIGAEYLHSDRLKSKFIVGTRKNSGDDSGTGKLYDFSSEYLYNKGRVNASYSRSINPSGANGLIETDRYRLSGDYDINSDWHLGASYLLNKNKLINDTEIQQMELNLTRVISRDWRLKTFVRHRERSTSTVEADGNVIGLSIIFLSPEF